MSESDLVAQLVPYLRSVGLFSRCSEYELKVVARRCTTRDVRAGDMIVRKGEDGSEMFLVLSCTAEARDGGRVFHTFTPGEYFGELAVLRPAPRTSDVIATSDGLLAVLNRNEMFLLLDSIPGVAKAMLQGLADTVREVKERADRTGG